MALTFLSRLRTAVGMAACLAISCGNSQTTAPKAPPTFSVETPKRRANFDPVAVFLPLDATVEPTWVSLRDELSPELDVIPIPISQDSTTKDFARALDEYSPRCVVLFDNRTTSLYTRYQASLPGQSFPPAVILLSSFASLYTKVQNSTGIAYEVSLLLSATRLRSLVTAPIERVGVIHRRGFQRYVRDQAALAKSEEIEVVAVEVPNDASPRDVAEALSKLAKQIDALWVLNDNALLTPEHIRDGWLPTLNERTLPTIVGISGLVTKDARFGTFAVIPDLGALGVQAASLIFDLDQNGWKIPDAMGIEEPLSVRAILDVESARANFGFKENMLGEITEVAGAAASRER
jgi:hypothetical protein